MSSREEKEEIYKKMISLAIKKVKTIIKSPAVRMAKDLEVLEVDDDGRVKDIKGDYKRAFDKLLNKYTEISGPAPVLMIKKDSEIQKILNENPDLRVPHRIKD